jgi:hypothetical protein
MVSLIDLSEQPGHIIPKEVNRVSRLVLSVFDPLPTRMETKFGITISKAQLNNRDTLTTNYLTSNDPPTDP